MSTTAKSARLSPVESEASNSSRRGAKRARHGAPVSTNTKNSNNTAQHDAVLRAACVQASVRCQELGWNGLASLLSASSTTATTANTPSTNNSSNTALVSLPTVEQTQIAAKKAVADHPPWVHWSKTDTAPQLRCNEHRCHLTSGPFLRGYRMARASHGAAAPSTSNTTNNTNNAAAYFFECKLLPGPTAHEIVAALPPHARLGPGLQARLQAALEREQKQQKKKTKEDSKGDDNTNDNDDSDSDSDEPNNNTSAAQLPPGGHVRVGFSMRTGDLQAPVGYDKWSYGMRDIGGSIIHQSQRQDSWGGQHFVPGDVMGCAIVLYAQQTEHERNHIRFFKNGRCLGPFLMVKGKRVGGEAFTDLKHGVYYPAVSTYLGGAVQANFGPHFIYPPRKLPAGLKKLQPFSDLCPPPTKHELKSNLLDKAGQAMLQQAADAEAEILMAAYEEWRKTQVAFVRRERIERGVSVSDLPQE